MDREQSALELQALDNPDCPIPLTSLTLLILMSGQALCQLPAEGPSIITTLATNQLEV